MNTANDNTSNGGPDAPTEFMIDKPKNEGERQEE